jgi:hypothetical protein
VGVVARIVKHFSVEWAVDNWQCGGTSSANFEEYNTYRSSGASTDKVSRGENGGGGGNCPSAFVLKGKGVASEIPINHGAAARIEVPFPPTPIICCNILTID